MSAFALSNTIRQDGAQIGGAPLRAIFGEFVLDVGRRELLRGTTPLHVSRKALHLLELMLRAAPDAVSKEKVYTELWGEVFVEETNIANLVYDLRNALGDDSRKPRLIRTLHRFGYRFDGEVRWESVETSARPTGRSWIVWGSLELLLAAGENVIGRDPDLRVSIDAAAISRRHARLTIGNAAFIEDLGSKNGTYVGGEQISGPVEIHDGDTLGFGSVRVIFRTMRGIASTVTDKRP